MNKSLKKRTQVPEYSSPDQLDMNGHESPFDQKSDPVNRIKFLVQFIHCDIILGLYFKFRSIGQICRLPLNYRNVTDSLFIKYKCKFNNRNVLTGFQTISTSKT